VTENRLFEHSSNKSTQRRVILNDNLQPSLSHPTVHLPQVTCWQTPRISGPVSTRPTHLPVLQRADSKDHLVSYSHSGYRCVWKVPQEYWHLHRSDWLTRTRIRALFNLWHQPKLANRRCAWSRRLCVICLNINPSTI
jgi:hypothetical protein